MNIPRLHVIMNDIQRSNARFKDICELAIIDYYKKLEKAQALKGATGLKNEDGVTPRAKKKEDRNFIPSTAVNYVNPNSSVVSEDSSADEDTSVQEETEEVQEETVLEETNEIQEETVLEPLESKAEVNIQEAVVLEPEAEEPPSKPLSRMNKDELLSECSKLNIADKINPDTMSNNDLIKAIKSA